MNRRLAQIMALLLAGPAASCVGPRTAEQSAKGKLLHDAERYVSELREQNQLPGFNSSEHGRLIAAAPWRGGAVSYPASVTIRAWKEKEDSSYSYALVKNEQEAPWRMISATHLDKRGEVLEQLLPK